VLSIAEIPVGIAKVPGLVRMTVIEDAVGQEVPALFPVNLISGLKCVLDFDDSTMLMKAFNRTAPTQTLPTGHFEVSMIDFPDGGWKVPDDLQGEYPPDAFMLPEGPPPRRLGGGARASASHRREGASCTAAPDGGSQSDRPSRQDDDGLSRPSRDTEAIGQRPRARG